MVGMGRMIEGLRIGELSQRCGVSPDTVRFYEREGWRPVYRYSRPAPFFHRDIPRIRFEYDVWRHGRS